MPLSAQKMAGSSGKNNVRSLREGYMRARNEQPSFSISKQERRTQISIREEFIMALNASELLAGLNFDLAKVSCQSWVQFSPMTFLELEGGSGYASSQIELL